MKSVNSNNRNDMLIKLNLDAGINVNDWFGQNWWMNEAILMHSRHNKMKLIHWNLKLVTGVKRQLQLVALRFSESGWMRIADADGGASPQLLDGHSEAELRFQSVVVEEWFVDVSHDGVDQRRHQLEAFQVLRIQWLRVIQQKYCSITVDSVSLSDS